MIGLGLSISRELARSLSGDLILEKTFKSGEFLSIQETTLSEQQTHLEDHLGAESLSSLSFLSPTPPVSGSTFNFMVKMQKNSNDTANLFPKDLLCGIRILIVNSHCINTVIMNELFCTYGAICRYAKTENQALQMLGLSTPKTPTIDPCNRTLRNHNQDNTLTKEAKLSKLMDEYFDSFAQSNGPVPFDVVIIDSSDSNFTLARRIKQDSNLCKISLVHLAYCQENCNINEIQNIGFSAHLTEPLHPVWALQVISRLKSQINESYRGEGSSPFITRYTKGTNQPVDVSTREKEKDEHSSGLGICSELVINWESLRVLLVEDNLINRKVAVREE